MQLSLCVTAGSAFPIFENLRTFFVMCTRHNFNTFSFRIIFAGEGLVPEPSHQAQEGAAGAGTDAAEAAERRGGKGEGERRRRRRRRRVRLGEQGKLVLLLYFLFDGRRLRERRRQ